MRSSSLYRFSAAVVAVLLGLGWSVPVGQAACTPIGPSAADRCDGSGPDRHDEGDLHPSPEGCLVHPASQEALTGRFPSPEIQEGGPLTAVDGAVVPSVRTSRSARSSIRAVVARTYRLHVIAGVWLE